MIDWLIIWPIYQLIGQTVDWSFGLMMGLLNDKLIHGLDGC